MGKGKDFNQSKQAEQDIQTLSQQEAGMEFQDVTNDLADSEETLKSESSMKSESMTETSQGSEGFPEKEIEKEIADLKDQHLRALAEVENVRRRAAQDKEEALKYGVTQLARDMLTISDNLQRGLEHIDKNTVTESLKPFLEGVEMTQKEMLTVFEKHGIKKVDPLGEVFNSNLHQAVFEEESQDHKPGTVMKVIQLGYTLHGRLLRPAMVGVAKKK